MPSFPGGEDCVNLGNGSLLWAFDGSRCSRYGALLPTDGRKGPPSLHEGVYIKTSASVRFADADALEECFSVYATALRFCLRCG